MSLRFSRLRFRKSSWVNIIIYFPTIQFLLFPYNLQFTISKSRNLKSMLLHLLQWETNHLYTDWTFPTLQRCIIPATVKWFISIDQIDIHVWCSVSTQGIQMNKHNIFIFCSVTVLQITRVKLTLFPYISIYPEDD